ncbi:DUF2267 domain-containing protein [Halopelagius longus]|uniref:DUF2267 domain-containing protein n=1 Tax=Halopelagius longus TaxID=1236180 RepID=A0A1H0Y6F3_9EURY|nr:DUF2267 domain-containing protein [Halopelagius longus]RDI72305.1 DUF2267 domain-containing protein [Halopelagius longus]SDQ10748.1 Uncharacterized conserved protein, DUF2267 family [Halopelagius longus]
MQREELLDGVARRARLESHDEAEHAALATLQTLGEHISEGEAEDVAERLPDEYEQTVTDRSDATPQEFSTEGFVRSVARRERGDVGGEEARTHARAVFATLADAGLEDELQDARSQLPDEFDTLFETDGLAE